MWDTLIVKYFYQSINVTATRICYFILDYFVMVFEAFILVKVTIYIHKQGAYVYYTQYHVLKAGENAQHYKQLMNLQ